MFESLAAAVFWPKQKMEKLDDKTNAFQHLDRFVCYFGKYGLLACNIHNEIESWRDAMGAWFHDKIKFRRMTYVKPNIQSGVKGQRVKAVPNGLLILLASAHLS